MPRRPRPGPFDRPAAELGHAPEGVGRMNSMGIGAPLARIEDIRLVTGNGRFANNVTVPGQLRGYVLRSPLGHARIRSIDVSGALEPVQRRIEAPLLEVEIAVRPPPRLGDNL